MPCKPSSFDETTQTPIEAGGVKTFIFGIKSKTDIYVMILVIAIFLILVFGNK